MRAEKCPSCPAVGDCISPGGRLCDLANPEHPDHRTDYRAMLAGRGAEPPDLAEPAETDQSMRDWAAERGRRAAEIHELILDCDYRTDTLNECSCLARHHCALSKGPWRNEPWAVSYDDCHQCVARPLHAFMKGPV